MPGIFLVLITIAAVAGVPDGVVGDKATVSAFMKQRGRVGVGTPPEEPTKQFGSRQVSVGLAGPS